ncbi:MAG: DUF2207 domain-containing protein [Bacilli bacterium]|nr:DUF2207 domain-containing protein [Bacilli bacterium]
MSKSAKWGLTIYVLIVIFILIMGITSDRSDDETSTGSDDYARITDVDYTAVLVDEPGEGGKVVITEILTFDIHAAEKDNLFWELWRDLPEDYVDGLKIDYKVNYVKEITPGKEKEYSESPKLYWYDSDYTSSMYGPGKWYHSEGPYDEDMARYECVFFYVDGLYREEVTFEIQYEMNNAALRYNDVSELYLSMYSEETIEHLESFKGQILIPLKDMPSKGNYEAHTYGTNSHTFDYKESKTKNPGYHTFYFELDENDLEFEMYNEYIEFSLLSFGKDKHIFTQYAPSNQYSHENYLEEAREAIREYDELPAKAEKTKNNLFKLSIISSIIVILLTLTKDKRLRKKHTFYEPSMKIEYFRDIPSDLDPYFASKLVFCKQNKQPDDGGDYSSLLLNLARKEYIRLEKIDPAKDWTFQNILIRLLYDPHAQNRIQKSTTETINEYDSRPAFATMAGNPSQKSFTSVTHINSINTINDALKPITPTIPTELRNSEGKVLEKLSPNEQRYFNLIVKYCHYTTITMNSFQNKVASDYDNTDSFVSNVERSFVNIGISQGYFQKADYTQHKRETKAKADVLLIFGILITILGNLLTIPTRIRFANGAFCIIGITLIICSIYLKHISKKYIQLTQFGEDEYTKWRGLYNFLNSETLMKERTVIDLVLWEKYLVYATAFGISHKVVKALEIRCPDFSTSQLLSNGYYRSTNFRTSSRSFRHTTRTASYRSRSYRSSGRTYYGGGGRGGGGGGGGH